MRVKLAYEVFRIIVVDLRTFFIIFCCNSNMKDFSLLFKVEEKLSADADMNRQLLS